MCGQGSARETKYKNHPHLHCLSLNLLLVGVAPGPVGHVRAPRGEAQMSIANPHHTVMLQHLRQTAGISRLFLRTLANKPVSAEQRFREKVAEAEKRRRQNAPEWEKREEALRKRYGDWNPTRKVSRQYMDDIRELKAKAPHLKTVQIADFFKMSPESIRRILKSTWLPTEAEVEKQRQRGERRKAESRERQLAQELEGTRALQRRGNTTQGARLRPYKARGKPRRSRPFTEDVGDFID